MLLLRDREQNTAVGKLVEEHTRLVRETHAGTADLTAVHAAKLARALGHASGSALYRHTADASVRADWPTAELRAPQAVLRELFPRLPLLGKAELSAHGEEAFTRPLAEFLHYYESSGTTGNPVAAPKAVDDLVINTINIGELWAQFLQPRDVALILINAPFAPAAYQFEKVLEYVGVMSFRPWVDNITGDYGRVLRLIESLSANVFVGPPSRLLEMIQFAHRSGLAAPRFDRLLLMAEQTGPSFVRHLERLTGGTAYVCSYGSSETGTTAVTCRERNLHLQNQSYLLELHDDTGTRPVDGSADRGELVVTTLDLPARPLLRYRTGDRVEITGEPCACGVRTPVLRTLGREQDVVALSGNGVRQNDLEAALWSTELPGHTVFNYMLVVRDRGVVLLVTTDGTPDETWNAVVAERLAPLFPGLAVSVRPVETLPPLASLGQYLGWKLSRVLDLNDERNWARLPEPINAVVAESLRQLGTGSDAPEGTH
ncbi:MULTISPECIES: phenylacetate--CoA ligase family protein [Streptomyces]|uniref:phenylacetate--CoA ligase family protein n=1 Tax=Streptomyces TaxID=1883 RepID=UPI000FFEC63E|nr:MULTISPECIES: phenylacetate--CoA ligase family protein [Streptomyces]